MSRLLIVVHVLMYLLLLCVTVSIGTAGVVTTAVTKYSSAGILVTLVGLLGASLSLHYGEKILKQLRRADAAR